MGCIAVLLATAPLAVTMSRSGNATGVIYSATFTASVVALAIASLQLLTVTTFPVAILTLPLGLPWLGANFRYDGLAAFFLIVVNLGGAAASIYGLGYGRHETAPHLATQVQAISIW
jgi:formate hydrogenlyase subunit 3/multisubunit Na+/H+ antiporter MnhD subunit